VVAGQIDEVTDLAQGFFGQRQFIRETYALRYAKSSPGFSASLKGGYRTFGDLFVAYWKKLFPQVQHAGNLTNAQAVGPFHIYQ
jgi:hypothetical protein